MFGLRRTQVIGSDRPRTDQATQDNWAVIQFPTSQVPVRLIAEEKQRSYEDVAISLGFKPAELISAQLMAFFEQEGLEIYDYGQVSAWLSEKKKQAGAEVWCWRPLREKDIVKGYQWGFIRFIPQDGYYSSGSWECRPYDLLVPKHALLKVQKIESRFGDDVKFFVSDYASPRVDPFIMVKPAKPNHANSTGEYKLVFDVWDEPGFGL